MKGETTQPTQPTLAVAEHRAAQRGLKSQERCCLVSIRVHTVLQTEWMLAKQADSRGGGSCADRVRSANPAPQTRFKEPAYLCRALMWASLQRRPARTREALQVRRCALAQMEPIIAATCARLWPRWAPCWELHGPDLAQRCSRGKPGQKARGEQSREKEPS